jgi:gliding motility-associated protein GldM
MAGGNVSPRQKMINMMYLVLTALLALQVSSEVLAAFFRINNSLKTSNKNTEDKIAAIYSKFEKEYQKNPAKMGPNFNKAKEIATIVDGTIAQIEKLKEQLIDMGGDNNKKMDKGDFKDGDPEKGWVGESNIDVAAQLFLGPNEAKPLKAGTDFEAMITKSREDLLRIVGAGKEGLVKIEAPKPTPKRGDQPEKSWLSTNFEHMPMAGVITILTKYQSDLRNSQSEIVADLLASADDLDIKVNKLEAKVIAKSTYILQGGKYEADIIVAAFDSTAQPKAFIGGNLLDNEGGVAKYSASASAAGVKKYEGYVEFPDPKVAGGIAKLPFKAEYEVGAPTAAVSADNMNVFYIGVDNPVTISASGVSANSLKANIVGDGTITQSSPGKFTVRVSGPATKDKKVQVKVIGMIEGKPREMGTAEFRVKAIPLPTAKVGAVEPTAPVSKVALTSQSSITATPLGFDFAVKYNVTEYQFYAFIPGKGKFVEDVKGSNLSGNVKSTISILPPGSSVVFRNIKASGPDGVKSLLPLTYEIK